MLWANEYSEITFALQSNSIIRSRVVDLVATRPIVDKATEGPGRIEALRLILAELACGKLNQPVAFRRVENDLPARSSMHRHNNRVFASRWGERLVRTQLSRFYNTAVIDLLLSEGETEGFVPHSSAEDPKSTCSRTIAGKSHSLTKLRDGLLKCYEQSDRSESLKIPHHPHCTHVIRPIQKTAERLANPEDITSCDELAQIANLTP